MTRRDRNPYATPGIKWKGTATKKTSPGQEMCPGRVGRATYTNNDGVRALITFSPNLGLKVFMDAHDTVTVEEGDRYPLRPPSYGVDT